MLNSNFVYLGFLINSFGGLTYIIDTLKGKVQPNKISWGLWALTPLIAFAAEIRGGVGIQSLLTFGVGFIPAFVFICSFINKKSYWKIEKLDILCAVLSLLGLLFWYITKVGNIAILFSILSDGLASVPTLVKAYNSPESESPYAYFGSTIAGIITLLTIQNWNFQNYAFPLYIVLMMGAIAVVIQFKVGRLFKELF